MTQPGSMTSGTVSVHLCSCSHLFAHLLQPMNKHRKTLVPLRLVCPFSVLDMIRSQKNNGDLRPKLENRSFSSSSKLLNSLTSKPTSCCCSPSSVSDSLTPKPTFLLFSSSFSLKEPIPAALFLPQTAGTVGLSKPHRAALARAEGPHDGRAVQGPADLHLRALQRPGLRALRLPPGALRDGRPQLRQPAPQNLAPIFLAPGGGRTKTLTGRIFPSSFLNFEPYPGGNQRKPKGSPKKPRNKCGCKDSAKSGSQLLVG